MKTGQKTRTLYQIRYSPRGTSEIRGLTLRLLERNRAKRIVKFLKARGIWAAIGAIKVNVGGRQDTARVIR